MSGFGKESGGVWFVKVPLLVGIGVIESIQSHLYMSLREVAVPQFS